MALQEAKVFEPSMQRLVDEAEASVPTANLSSVLKVFAAAR
jgi:hypothetical protein